MLLMEYLIRHLPNFVNTPMRLQSVHSIATYPLISLTSLDSLNLIYYLGRYYIKSNSGYASSLLYSMAGVN